MYDTHRPSNHDNLFRILLQRKMEGKRQRERPRLIYVQQVKRKMGVVANQEVKQIATEE